MKKIFNADLQSTKVIKLFILCLALQIPLLFVKGVIQERSNLYKTTTLNIGNEWGGEQILTGPVILLPYLETYSETETIEIDGKKTDKITKKERTKYLLVLPDDLSIDSVLNEEKRNRGIYKTLVYTGSAHVEGSFSLLNIENSNEREYLYDNMRLIFGMTDTQALIEISNTKLNNKKLDFESGTYGVPTFLLDKGMNTRVTLQENMKFEMDIKFRGSQGLSLIPLGKKNHFTITSPWGNPSFRGLLPNSKEITKEGFSATWKISNLVRNYSQKMTLSSDIQLGEAIAGVQLYEGITHYKQVERAVKYGILFIMLSVLITYLFEIVGKQETHLIQYGIIGFSLVLFYLLLLSLSEHIKFGVAYTIATGVIILPISWYLSEISKSLKNGVKMFLILLGVFIVLYSILQMENYALLTGSILILMVTYVLMYLTRKEDYLK